MKFFDRNQSKQPVGAQRSTGFLFINHSYHSIGQYIIDAVMPD